MVAKKTAAAKAAKAAPAQKAGPASSASAAEAAPASAAKAAPAKKGAAKAAPVKKAAKAASAKAAPANKRAAASSAKKAAGASPAKKTAPAKATKKAAPAKAAKAAPAKKSAAKAVSAKKSAAKAAGATAAAGGGTGAGALAVRPGEEPWSAAEVSEARTELQSEVLRLRAEIAHSQEAISGLMRDSGDGAGDDQADTGTKNITREHELALAANAGEMLEQTERALERLDAGTYGLCENCGKPIGKARMQAFPRATLCVECKQRQERR
ncbi:TraR/DksA family transcriptional regulator [Streptomyces sp. NPDC002537]